MKAWRFILLMGLVSLLADMTYEGARSITGPFLGVLGASAFVVGLVSGLGELAGYALRLASGVIADRTHRYWTLTLGGYAINLLAVPALALTGHWAVAAGLIVLERLGKGLRTPARDAMLSYAARQVGPGKGFGLHEALDQIGAVTGPLWVALALALGGGYRVGFAVLGVPAILALTVLLVARWQFPEPAHLEAVPHTAQTSDGSAFPPTYRWYLAFSALAVAGFAPFPLIAYHMEASQVITGARIPLLFSLAMGADALMALGVGGFYDRVGLRMLLLIPLFSFPLPFLAFSRLPGLVILGAVLWGLVMGVHETLMRAAVADLIPPARRGTAYGLFHTVYGIAWFVGSGVMGALYGLSPLGLMAFAAAAQLLSLIPLSRLKG